MLVKALSSITIAVNLDLSRYLELMHKYIYYQYNHVQARCTECLCTLKYQDIPSNVLAACIKKTAQLSYCKGLYSQK